MLPQHFPTVFISQQEFHSFNSTGAAVNMTYILVLPPLEDGHNVFSNILLRIEKSVSPQGPLVAVLEL